MTSFAPHKEFHKAPEPAHIHTKDCWMTGDQKCIAWRVTKADSDNIHLTENLGRIRQTMREMKGILDRMDVVIERELNK